MAFSEDVLATILITAKDEASATLERVGAEAEASGGRVKRGMSVVGGAITAAAVGMGAAAIASIDMAAKFQSSMELIHTQAGAAQSEVEKMSKSVLDLSGSVATSPITLSEALYHVESAGYRGA